ncbi:MAG: exodeoxyribonuclease VII large subunit [Verrucomicrobiota bacterium]
MEFNMTAEAPIVSVSELTQGIKLLLEGSLPDVRVRGEVSNLRRQSSGHIYFSLKDTDAQIKAVLFKFAANAQAKAMIENGRQLIIRGRLSVYEPQGTYSIVVQELEEDGVGELQRRFEALKRKLSEEGLFDLDNRKPIPPLPKRIAVVTSATGAAIKDFLGILERREWVGEVTIFNARVQGAEAISSIVSQIDRVSKSNAYDLLVLTRGGGSLEDLWAFNEEAVVRALAACPLPKISAVGHEIDFVLTDFAADWRAETPSGAAERISSAFADSRQLAESLEERLDHGARQALRSLDQRLDLEAQRLKSFTPQHRLERMEMLLDERAIRLEDLVQRRLEQSKTSVDHLQGRWVQAEPITRILQLGERVNALAERLETCSAHRTLQRGFALVKDTRGRIVSEKTAASKGRRLEVHFQDGALWTVVEKDQDQTQMEI